MRKKKILAERKGINDSIVDLSDAIADRILLDVPKQAVMVSTVLNEPYVEGDFVQKLNGEIDGLEEIKVHYLLYSFGVPSKYNMWYDFVKVGNEPKNYNSYADYDNGEIQIVSTYIGDKIMPSFAENILHEITHLYQYGKGMEKRNDLYHNAIMMAQSRNRLTSAIGKTIYYTFSHEQDAMVHQFYGFLLQNKGILGFNEALRHSEYANAVNALKEALDLKGDAAEVIKQTGLSVKQWKMRVHFGYKRFKQKMYNVYLRWFQERERRNILQTRARILKSNGSLWRKR